MDSLSLNELAEKVRSRRRELGWSTDQLALKSGVSATRINQVENGTISEETGKVRRPKPETVTKLANALRLPPKELLRAAGYAAPEAGQPTGRGARMLHLFDGLPPEKQEDLLIYAEAMFRKYGVASELRGVKELGGEERRMPVTKANQNQPRAGKAAGKKARAA
jgi:transcriptional regulator with XRE-family HTH domain